VVVGPAAVSHIANLDLNIVADLGATLGVFGIAALSVFVFLLLI